VSQELRRRTALDADLPSVVKAAFGLREGLVVLSETYDVFEGQFNGTPPCNGGNGCPRDYTAGPCGAVWPFIHRCPGAWHELLHRLAGRGNDAARSSSSRWR
jgi:hypothetical protein